MINFITSASLSEVLHYFHFHSPYILVIKPVITHNINMDFQEGGWGGVSLLDLAQDRDRWRALVNEVMNLRVP
jgi:hypothetical protein